MDEVFTFNKTYQERYLEYNNVLGGYEVLPASEIKKEWVYYLELTLDPSGWQAIWKIPRLKCEQLDIQFPTIVLAYVENVDFQELKATIKILAVQDDIHLPNRHQVSLTQLWVTKNQDKSIGLNLELTANSIDMLYFFYTYIFMPWDLEDEDTVNWLSRHLESRLHLYYDLRNGVIPRATADRLMALLNEARRLQARKEQIELEMDHNVVDTIDNNKQVQNLLKIHIRSIQIRTEVEIFENPLLRGTALQLEEELTKEVKEKIQNWIVFQQGKIDDFISFLNHVKEYIPDENIKSASTLITALDEANANDTIILSPTRHLMTTLAALREGGTLKGLHSKTDTILYSNNENVMLDFGGDITLENLTIDVQFAECGIVVRSGTATIRNCKIIGDGESSIHQGVLVLAGGKLNMIDCEISEFYTAIVGNSGSTLTLERCAISNVNFGLKMYDNCNVKIENSTFNNCKEYGMCIETNKDEVHHVGDFSLLQSMPTMTIIDITGKDNTKGDVIIHKRAKLKPISDLFSNPKENPTISHHSDTDTDMDTDSNDENICDKTIIEFSTAL